MSEREVRRGLTQGNFNQEAWNYIAAEIIIIAIAFGLYTQSWIVFGIVFIGMIVGLNIPSIAIILVAAFTLMWAAIGYWLGSIFGSFAASFVLMVIAFLSSLGLHLSAIQYMEDLNQVNSE